MKKTATIFAQVALLLGFAALAAQAQTIPSGTPIMVVLNHDVNSKTAKPGDSVSASVASNVNIGGKVVIPQGSTANVIVSSATSSGRLSTPGALSLRLTSVVVNGQTYNVSAGTAGVSGKSHKTRNVVAIGGGTAAGALIGGLVGGGKGAAIGAGAGAATGTAGAAATGKKDVDFPAETKLSFTLTSPVTIK